MAVDGAFGDEQPGADLLVGQAVGDQPGDIGFALAERARIGRDPRTGSTVTSAGLVLAGTFGVFALVEAGQPGGGVFRDILASLALGILMDAFLVRTLLVPSTVALLGRWNWWPSRHGVAGSLALWRTGRGIDCQPGNARTGMRARARPVRENDYCGGPGG